MTSSSCVRVLLCVAAALLLLSAAVDAKKVSGHHRHAAKHQEPSAAAAKVAVGVYEESFCPDCIAMMVNYLYPAFVAGLDQIIDLTIVPYGNAKETQTPTGWNFTCQHGAKECAGNVIETCAIKYYPDVNTHFKFIHCMEAAANPLTAAPACGKSLGLDWDAINKCATGAEGNALEHAMAVKTDALVPKHQWVPWVTVNGEHNEDWDGNPVAAICAAYKGTNIPEPCMRLQVNFYFESYCPGCQQLSQTLLPVVQNFSAIADFNLFPYGNCKRTAVPGTSPVQYNYTCQHGENECIANVYEQCALEQPAHAFDFILCLEKSGDPVSAAKGCAEAVGYNYQTDILDCASKYGAELQDEYATATEKLNPAHTYVPWVTINGQHSTDAEDDPIKAICAAYKGYQTVPICQGL